MVKLRKPFQGVVNIIRFNWPYYVLPFLALIIIYFSRDYLNPVFNTFIISVCVLIIISMAISLMVSYYIYDISGLYNFPWIKPDNSVKIIVNVNAGFDETSGILKNKFNNSKLIILDFYNPELLTELSIQRARKIYPAGKEVRPVKSNNLELANDSVDMLFVIFAAHEIRNLQERTKFFMEIHRIIKPSGSIIIVEHLRDYINFLAYNIGFFHFYKKETWINIFREAGLNLKEEKKITPFVSSFILSKNGNTY